MPREGAPSNRTDSPEESQQYTIRARLDLSEIEKLDRSMPLRVAAVRENKVVDSEVIDLEQYDDVQHIPVDLEFQIPGRRRCGVQFVVSRGDIPVAEILGLTNVTHRIMATDWKERTQGSNPYVVELGDIVIPAHIYGHWITICRRFTIRGRVVCRDWYYDRRRQQWVFTDAPVPGATVEAYDVDCWWWWCFRDLIGTAVTDVNGFFSMSFTWCCRRWFPFHVPWVVNPNLLDRIRELLREARVPVGPIPPDPPVDPVEFQEFLYNIATPPATQQGAAPTPATSAQALKALLPPAPDLEALHVWPWWHRRDCTPDVVFRATQECEGTTRVIYEEDLSQTRWNIAQTTFVTLEANDEACCLPPPPEQPCGDCLSIFGIGCQPGLVTVDDIGTSAGPPDLRGYAYPGTRDRPFGGRLNVWGEFGEDSYPVVDFYRVEYHKEGMAPGTWIDAGTVAGLLGAVVRQYANPTPPPAFAPPINFGPQDFVGDGNRYYKTRYKYERDNAASKPSFGWLWTNASLLFVLNSQNLPESDGLYTFRVVTYRQAADGSLVDERIMPLCGTEDDDVPTPATLMVRTDNRNVPHPPSTPTHPCGSGTVHTCTAEPDCDVIAVIKNAGTPGAESISACDFATIADTDQVTIRFSATVPATSTDGHLLAYEMTAHYGESAYFDVLTAGTLAGVSTPYYGPTYSQALAQGATRPFWYGGTFEVTVSGSAFEESCAYLLRLRAWKRTFNGCTAPKHFHWNVTEFSFCVIKP